MAMRPKRTLGLCMLLILTLVGCVDPAPSQRVNSPFMSDTESRSNVSEFFAYHNDQGMISDQSLADIHFIPHSTHLSGTGESRLKRYAELLAETGGTLHYDTPIRDAKLVEARLTTARRFLRQKVAGKHVIKVVLGMPKGRGMDAVEAAAGQDVAKQPEPRGTAYDLSGAENLEVSGK